LEPTAVAQKTAVLIPVGSGVYTVTQQQRQPAARLEARNIGGIDQTDITFEPGITVLAGRNATNRTSLLQALMAALGSEAVSIKADATEAAAELTLDGTTYTRTYRRKGDVVVSAGDPYLDDPTEADLFAFLLATNPARQAVITDDDLRELMMAPVDTDTLQTQIDEVADERDAVVAELNELDELKSRVPQLEAQRTQLQTDIEELQSELLTVEDKIDDMETETPSGDAEQSDRAALEAKLEALSEVRTELSDIEYRLETERASLDELHAEQADLEQRRADLADDPDAELAQLDARITSLRADKQELETTLSELQQIIQFNRQRLETAPEGVLEQSAADGAVTDELLPSTEITCWTCGSEVDTAAIEATISALEDRRETITGSLQDLDAELDELTTERETLQAAVKERERLEERSDELEAEISATEDRIDKLTARREAYRENVSELEAEVDALESHTEASEADTDEALLELHQRATELEYELGTQEDELERVTENLAQVEARLEEESALERERDALREELTSLRTRIERLEDRAVEAFNEHMDAVLDALAYENLERIWLEAQADDGRGGGQTGDGRRFELHVVRTSEDGTAYEDTVETLSESEQQVTGLVFALAGYLAHDVYESVPFMLLDSVEAIDATRIAGLVEYLAEFSEFLIVALLEEDADAVPADQVHRMSS
jgi:predicted nuclease with TOPRIM domain